MVTAASFVGVNVAMPQISVLIPIFRPTAIRCKRINGGIMLAKCPFVCHARGFRENATYGKVKTSLESLIQVYQHVSESSLWFEPFTLKIGGNRDILGKKAKKRDFSDMFSIAAPKRRKQSKKFQHK
jgi:hypothetical protein